jgi:hypothetical protein
VWTPFYTPPGTPPNFDYDGNTPSVRGGLCIQEGFEGPLLTA